MRAGLAELNMVERIVIDGLSPGAPGSPTMWNMTPHDRSALRIGLKALVAEFHLDEDRPRETPQDERISAAPGANGAANGADPPRQRRRGLDVVFSPATDARPDEADVAAAVTRLRKSPI
jgi:hypothetical protein